ncbi:MAG: hypothetical protein Q9168_006413 [Polycauliona sp. 1 TL-2023]
MSKADEHRKREHELAAAGRPSAGYSSEEEEEEVAEAIRNLIMEIDSFKTSEPGNTSNGEDSNDERATNDTENQDQVEEKYKAADPKECSIVHDDHTTDAGTGMCEKACAEAKTPLAIVHRDPSSYPPDRPFQTGLGSLSFLAPEIRSQIWGMIIPTTNFCFEVKPKQKPNPGRPRNHGAHTLAICRASKLIHHEIEAQFYHHNRSLAVIITATRNPSARQISYGKAQSSSPGLILDGTYSSVSRFTRFARFTIIKVFIELPGRKMGWSEIEILENSIQRFIRSFFRWQLDQKYGKSRTVHPTPRFEILVCVQTPVEVINDPGRKVELDLSTLACWLQPFRKVRDSKYSTIRVDCDIRYGKDWLPELLHQVLNEMQNDRIGHRSWQWRQKHMQIALAQCHILTSETEGQEYGGPLPIGPPDTLVDDAIEYRSPEDPRYIYNDCDFAVYLATGQLPFRPPGRAYKVKSGRPLCPHSSDESSSGTTDDERSNSADTPSKPTSTKTLHKAAPNNLSPDQAPPLPSGHLGLEEEKQRPSTFQASELNPSLIRSDTPIVAVASDKQISHSTALENPPVIHPWNKYKTSPVPKAEGAASVRQAPNHQHSQPDKAMKPATPDSVKFTDLELVLMGIMLASILFWLHRSI